MLYLSGVMHSIPGVGFMQQPNSANRVPAGMTWALDNGCFAGAFAERRYLAMVAPDALFCALPDVVADWKATLKRSMPWLDRVRERGGRPAIVLQDGCQADSVPWNEVDAVFIGGSTEWKLGATVPRLVTHALWSGKWVHMGRVNSLRRLRYACHIGCDSADGTFLAWAPETNRIRMMRWFETLRAEGITLW